MPIETTTTATCDYSLCGVQLDAAAIPVRSTYTLRFPNGALQHFDGCACTPGHLALAAQEWAAAAQAALAPETP